jgi:hypothetical protein
MVYKGCGFVYWKQCLKKARVTRCAGLKVRLLQWRRRKAAALCIGKVHLSSSFFVTCTPLYYII